MFGVVRRLNADYNIEWVSGGCDQGPDKIITTLASTDDINHTIYLPNEKRQLAFGRRYPKTNNIVAADYTSDLYRKIVDELHPAPQHLNDWSYGLHGRNLNIIAGKGLDEPVDAVFFSADTDYKGNVKGGTGMGHRYALTRDIPCYNAKNLSEVTEFMLAIK